MPAARREGGRQTDARAVTTAKIPALHRSCAAAESKNRNKHHSARSAELLRQQRNDGARGRRGVPADPLLLFPPNGAACSRGEEEKDRRGSQTAQHPPVVKSEKIRPASETGLRVGSKESRGQHSGATAVRLQSGDDAKRQRQRQRTEGEAAEDDAAVGAVAAGCGDGVAKRQRLGRAAAPTSFVKKKTKKYSDMPEDRMADEGRGGRDGTGK